MFHLKNINSAYIHNPIEIYNLLKNIQKSRQIIAVSFGSNYPQSLTSLLEVNHNKKTLLFDEPNPVLNSKQMELANNAQLSLKYEQLPVSFTTSLSLLNTDTDSSLHAPFPTEIYYPQNRKFYRFSTNFVKDIETTIFLSSEKRLTCKLMNISLNGLNLQLPYAFAKAFQSKQVINDIYIQLPKQTGFSVAAKIKNSRIVNNYNNISLGLEILEQNPAIEKSIQQFIYRSENS